MKRILRSTDWSCYWIGKRKKEPKIILIRLMKTVKISNPKILITNSIIKNKIKMIKQDIKNLKMIN